MKPQATNFKAIKPTTAAATNKNEYKSTKHESTKHALEVTTNDKKEYYLCNACICEQVDGRQR